MYHEKKSVPVSFEKVIKVVLYIIFISLATYAIMAVITHFSLNYLNKNYTFSQSLISIFDTKTAMFKFFRAFAYVEGGFVILALIIKLIKDKVF